MGQKGVVMFLTTSIDTDWNNLPARPSSPFCAANFHLSFRKGTASQNDIRRISTHSLPLGRNGSGKVRIVDSQRFEEKTYSA